MDLILIPLDIWKQICSYLENLDLTNLLRTCHFFRKIQFFKYKLYLKDYSNTKYFLRDRYLNTTHLYLNFPSLSKSIFSNNLKKIILTIKNSQYTFIKEENWSLNSSTSNSINLTIENYYFTNIFIPSFVKKLNLKNFLGTYINLKTYLSLKELKISNEKNFLVDIPENLEKLTCIKLKAKNELSSLSYLDCPILNDNLKILYLGKIILPKKFPNNLKELTLNNCILINLENLQNISKLVVKNIVETEDVIHLEKLLTSASYLKELEIDSHHIDESSHLTIDFSSDIVKEEIIYPELILPNTIEKLIVNINYRSFNLNKHISKLENLKELTLIVDEEIIDYNKEIISPSLEQLTLIGNYHLWKENFETPNLKKIILTENFKGMIDIPLNVIIINKNKNANIKNNKIST